MANTPYIDLVKPAGTDKALISVINANSDKIDSAVGGVQDALAIVCNGNTHGAITSGQYVYVRAHDTLQEGLYTANSNIAANATLSSSNLTANSSGGLNALNEQIGNTYIKSYNRIEKNTPYTFSYIAFAHACFMRGSSGRKYEFYVDAYGSIIWVQQSDNDLSVSVNSNVITITDNTSLTSAYVLSGFAFVF